MGMKALLKKAALLVAVVLLPAAVHGQNADQAPAEMKVLQDLLVGKWRFTSSNGMTRTMDRQLVLNGYFVQSEVFSYQGQPTNRKIYGYDAKEKVYRAWWFLPGAGVRAPLAMEFTGTWDEDSKTLTLTADRDKTSITNTIRLVDADTQDVTVIMKGADGRVLQESVGKATRLALGPLDITEITPANAESAGWEIDAEVKERHVSFTVSVPAPLRDGTRTAHLNIGSNRKLVASCTLGLRRINGEEVYEFALLQESVSDSVFVLVPAGEAQGGDLRAARVRLGPFVDAAKAQ
jgi:hypothetical protein